MKIRIFIVLMFIFGSKTFGQSVTLLPNNINTEKSSFNVLESANESALTLKRSNSDIYTSLSFRNHQNTYLGGVSFGSQNALISIPNDNGIGFNIGSNSATVMQIRLNEVIANVNFINYGTIRSSSLEFTSQNTPSELRPVFADKYGVLRVESPSNRYASYNFSAVQAQDYDDQLRKGSGFAWFNTTNIGATMYLPVNLPDGVKVTNVRLFLFDNSASNLSFTFNKNSHLSNTFTAIATAQSSTNTANVFSINDNANEIIDNQNNSYYVNISSVGNWTGNTLQFHSLVITYQYQ